MTNRRRVVGLLVAVGVLLPIAFRSAERATIPWPGLKNESAPPVQSAALGWSNLPGPRPPVVLESEEPDLTDAQLAAETQRAIRESRDLAKVEAMIRRTLNHRPVDMELKELIGDIQLKRGETEAALASYLDSQTSNNDMSLTPKLIALYGELRLGDQLEEFLTSSEANILDRATWQNRSPEEKLQRRLAARSVCSARYADEDAAAECLARLVPRK